MHVLEVPPSQLLLAAIIGIAVIVALITWAKLHAFLSLTIGSLVVGLLGGLSLAGMIKSFTGGVGSTVAGVGVLIALGAIVGKMLADSGGADTIVDKIVGNGTNRARLPWAMAAVGALIGLPMFFEIGLVMLIPVIVLVARRSKAPIMSIGIPALAGLSAMHALVPPHPGPLAAVGLLKADLGITLGLGVLVAIPTIAIAGPLFGRLAAKMVPIPAPELFVSAGEKADALSTDDEGRALAGAPGATATGEPAPSFVTTTHRPSFGLTMLTVLLPVVLMMGKSLADIFLKANNPLRHALDFIGEPLIALLLTALMSLFTLGVASKMPYKKVTDTVGNSLPAIAGILLIVGAGGGFKQVLVDTGIGTMLGKWIAGSPIPALLLAWFVAVLIRLATGSATVATITAAGILAPVVAQTHMSPFQTALIVLAIGCGSVFFSHVNDAGFWLVKEYFGTSVGQNLKTWSLMETVLSVVGVIFIWILSALGGAAGW